MEQSMIIHKQIVLHEIFNFHYINNLYKSHYGNQIQEFQLCHQIQRNIKEKSFAEKNKNLKSRLSILLICYHIYLIIYRRMYYFL